MRNIILALSICVSTCLLHSVKGNTYPPVFVGNSVFQISEDTAIGSEVFTVSARDDDHDPITYSLRGSEATRYFSINNSTGVVILFDEIDREEYVGKGERFTIQAVINDMNYERSKTLTIIILDANDNYPQFKSLPYQKQLPEGNYTNDIFFNAKAEDKDAGEFGRVHFSIEVVPRSPTLQFHIYPSNGNISINGRLDYAENIIYQIKINASDNGANPKSSAAILIVNVEDKPNRPPEFRNEIYQATITENTAVGNSVLTVSAVDGDRGINNNIVYELKGNSSYNFGINAATGEIKTATIIDRENTTYIEAGDTITFYVQASEVLSEEPHSGPSTATATVIVSVTDVNDNPPTFYRKTPDGLIDTPMSTFEVNLLEESSEGSPITDLNMYIRDPDKRDNGTVSLSINSTVFEIVPTSIVNEGPLTVRVKSSNHLDYEQIQVLYVQVTATDGVATTTAILTINLVDINDNSPIFSQDQYVIEVSEGASNGDFIYTVQASDSDSGSFAVISFNISGAQDVRDTFIVNGQTGELRVLDNKQLDRETKPVFYANIIATDGGGRVSSVPLEIKVLDVNDNNPKFQQTAYQAFYKENNHNDPILISATDKDEEGTPNSNITYSIVGGDDFSNFTIDAVSGQLTVNGNLDREFMETSLDGKFTLTVMAQDQGIPPLNSTVLVTISVEDLNDETPIFTKSVYTASIPENAAPGHLVVSAHAWDLDASAPNNRVSYSIFSGSRGNFLIRTVPVIEDFIGNISVDSGSQLDYETVKNYTMVIVASDLGFPERGSNATVVVHITDVNDETPKIDNLPRAVSAHENGEPGAAVFNVIGQDVDTDADLQYAISDQSCYKGVVSVNKSECVGWFHVNGKNGTVSYGNVMVDFELIDRVDLTLLLTDLATVEKRNSTSDVLTINILDTNDNHPIFQIKPSTGVIVTEIANDKYEFSETWQATDSDVGENAKLTFSVTKLLLMHADNTTVEQDKGIFSMKTVLIDNSQYKGTMGITKSINPKQDGSFIITVMVSDNGSPPLKTSTNFTAFLISESNKVELQFDGSVEEIEAKRTEISINLNKVVYSSIVAITAIKPFDAQQTREAKDQSKIDVYFYFSNGTAVNRDRAMRVIQDSVGTEAVQTLIRLGMTSVGGNADIGDPRVDELKQMKILVISLAVAALLILVVMITIAVCMRRSYKRKLKSMAAMNRAKEVKCAPAQQGTQVPGTNMHATEKSNPLWNSPIYELPDLGYIEESDPDKKSLNSLDENVLDASDLKIEEMEMAEKKVPRKDQGPKHNENTEQSLLGAALQQRDMDRTARDMKFSKILQGTDNNALDTTDI